MPASARLAPENGPAARSPAHPRLRTTRLPCRLLASEQNDLELCDSNFGNAGLVDYEQGLLILIFNPSALRVEEEVALGVEA